MCLTILCQFVIRSALFYQNFYFSFPFDPSNTTNTPERMTTMLDMEARLMIRLASICNIMNFCIRFMHVYNCYTYIYAIIYIYINTYGNAFTQGLRNLLIVELM